VKAAFFGAFIAAFVLVEIWANLNPVRMRLGLPELSSAALYRQPSGGTESHQAANDQSNAEIRSPSAAANPSPDIANRHSDDGKGLDWPAWIQAASAVVTGCATILLVRITGRQAGLTERQVEVSQLQTTIYRLQASIMDRQLVAAETASQAATMGAAVAQQSAEAAIESNQISRELFITEQRPWIDIDADTYSSLTWDKRGAHLSIMFQLTNVGRSPATDVRFEASGFVVGSANPEPITALRIYCEDITSQHNEPKALGTTVFPGKPSSVNFGLTILREEIIANLVNQPDWFVPMIKTCVTYRGAGFTDIKYTGRLYVLAAKHDTDRSVFMVLRISNGDLSEDKFGIGPYPGGDIAS